jgi:hypothetical protein
MLDSIVHEQISLLSMVSEVGFKAERGVSQWRVINIKTPQPQGNLSLELLAGRRPLNRVVHAEAALHGSISIGVDIAGEQ